MASKARDNFSPKTKAVIATRAAYRCAMPDCRRLTVRPDHGSAETAYMGGVAAHISAAAERGPRYDAAMTEEERRSAENGVWLCRQCGDLVDATPNSFSREMLIEMKANAESWATVNYRRVDEIIGLVERLVDTHEAILAFNKKWAPLDPMLHAFPGSEPFHELRVKLETYSAAVLEDYQSSLQPIFAKLMPEVELMLVGTPKYVEDVRQGISDAWVNPQMRIRLADALAACITVLEKR